MEKSASNKSSFFNLSHENLEIARLYAIENADFTMLQELAAEARARDGWGGFDDTDPTWAYFAMQCTQDIKDVMPYYG